MRDPDCVSCHMVAPDVKAPMRRLVQDHELNTYGRYNPGTATSTWRHMFDKASASQWDKMDQSVPEHHLFRTFQLALQMSDNMRRSVFACTCIRGHVARRSDHHLAVQLLEIICCKCCATAVIRPNTFDEVDLALNLARFENGELQAWVEPARGTLISKQVHPVGGQACFMWRNRRLPTAPAPA